MKIKITVILWFCAVIGSAQVTVKQDVPVSGLKKGMDFHPIFSPDGDKLLVTSANYTGLDVYDVASQSVKHITDDTGAGFGVSFDKNGEKVYFRQTLIQNGRQYKVLKSYNEKDYSVTKLSEPLRTQEEQHVQLRTLSSDPEIRVCTEKLKLVLYKNGQRTEMEPVGNVPGYVWASLSPDKKMILFTAATKGTFVCDLSGKIVASLGKLNAPVWYDNRYVVGMDDKDNGENVTSSRIVIASLDGKVRQNLTPENKIAMYPSASAKTQRIAYCTGNGGVYMMEISINQ